MRRLPILSLILLPAVSHAADFDGAEYGGEGGAVVGEEVVHALQAIGFLLGLGF